MNVIETKFASEVIEYDDLYRTMLYDTGGSNIYIMNYYTAQKFCEKYDIKLAPRLAIGSHAEIQVYGYTIHILSVMPDDEIVVIDKSHPHW